MRGLVGCDNAGKIYKEAFLLALWWLEVFHHTHRFGLL